RVFGRKQEASDEETGPLKHPRPPLPAEDGRFRQVTDVAWDKAGNTFISDGYINSRVAKMDKNGNCLKSRGDPRNATGQINTPHPHQVLYSSDAWPGRIYKLSLEGKVLGVLGQSGKQLKQFGWIHAMACPTANVIYVAELLNWRVQKLILKPRCSPPRSWRACPTNGLLIVE